MRGFSEIRLGFDRETGRLVRIAYKSSDPDAAREVETEMTFSEFKEVSGLIRPMHCVLTRGGKSCLDLTIEKFTPLEKIDPAVFTLPE